MNLASRIADEASPGEVLVSRAVAAAAEGPTLDLHRVDRRILKGIAEPVVLFSVVRAPELSM